MKNKHHSKKAILLFAAGLLITGLTSLIGYYLPIEDAARGALMGVGIGLELIALIWIIRNKRLAAM